jgi:hypothetical protein
MRAAGAVLVAALALGCHSSEENPPPPTCVGDCGLPPGLGSELPPSGSGGGENEGGSGPGTSGVELTGNVLQLNDDVNFVSGTLFTGQADLKTEGANGKNVTGLWDGSDPFFLEGVRVATPVWVLATPQNPMLDDALAGMEPVRTDAADSQGRVSANLALVRSTTIDQIFNLATVPLANDPTKAQIILRLVGKASGNAEPPPLAGVKVTAPAEDILYGASGSFSDVVTETDVTGVVILANVPGAVYPGALVSVEFSGTANSGAQVRAVTGAVTLATIAP